MTPGLIVFITIWSLSVAVILTDIITHVYVTAKYDITDLEHHKHKNKVEADVDTILMWVCIILLAPMPAIGILFGALFSSEPQLAEDFGIKYLISKKLRNSVKANKELQDYNEVLRLIEYKEKPEEYWEMKRIEHELDVSELQFRYRGPTCL